LVAWLEAGVFAAFGTFVLADPDPVPLTDPATLEVSEPRDPCGEVGKSLGLNASSATLLLERVDFVEWLLPLPVPGALRSWLWTTVPSLLV
jgi:hypothetical protein